METVIVEKHIQRRVEHWVARLVQESVERWGSEWRREPRTNQEALWDRRHSDGHVPQG